jgi:hypothetical protein
VREGGGEGGGREGERGEGVVDWGRERVVGSETRLLSLLCLLHTLISFPRPLLLSLCDVRWRSASIHLVPLVPLLHLQGGGAGRKDGIC